MNGLALMDRRERAAFRTLPLSAQLVILDELAYDPTQADSIRSLLREPNPTKAVADQIAAEVTAATYGVSISDVGMGRSWKKTFKKVVSKVVEAPKKVYEKVVEKVNLKNTVAYALAPATAGASLLITNKGREALRKASQYAKTYGPTALSIAGIIAAPFTGGATLAIPALVQGYQTVRANKVKAKELERQGAAEAQAAQEAVAQQEQQAVIEIDTFYNENAAIFAQAGYPPEVWATMTVDEKYATLNKLQGAAEAVGSDVAAGYETAAASGGPTYQGSLERDRPDSLGPVSTGEARFSISINGARIGASPSVLEQAMSTAESQTSNGDKVEIFDRGASLGLWVKTSSGLIKVPADQMANVKAMSAEQSRALVAQAEEKAGGVKSGGFPFWILAVPVVAYAASK